MQTNHKNGNKSDNQLRNLEWLSASDNMKHKYRTGLATVSGENNPAAKLTWNQVREIRCLLAMGAVQKEIGKLFNVARHTITDIKSQRHWKEK